MAIAMKRRSSVRLRAGQTDDASAFGRRGIGSRRLEAQQGIEAQQRIKAPDRKPFRPIVK